MRWTRRERPVLTLQRRKHALQAPLAAREYLSSKLAHKTWLICPISGDSIEIASENMAYFAKVALTSYFSAK
ncbi:hypothetical protein [Paenibacillus cymbidii]|uniref:hypothetical protein n=1 Tax=Paenibacillus cymbidii TaxID=1639034 RepID=UPI001081925E|nr:hypothetical protein [Paenibacillus cymbidii]